MPQFQVLKYINIKYKLLLLFSTIIYFTYYYASCVYVSILIQHNI